MTFPIILYAIWLGIMTSISPCPLASNIAAITFVGRKAGSRYGVLFSGLLYTCGRVLVYLVLAIVITAGLMATSSISLFLQEYMNEILGPVLILTGMVLLGMIGSKLSLFNPSGKKLQERAEKRGLFFAFPLGMVFALAFCPVSAGLFFGGLIPLSLNHSSKFILPFCFGAGTALPVIVFSFIIASGSKALGKAFNKLTLIEKWGRNITGTIFILAGIYYCLAYIYGYNILSFG